MPLGLAVTLIFKACQYQHSSSAQSVTLTISIGFFLQHAAVMLVYQSQC
jgi:hypothetical protein